MRNICGHWFANKNQLRFIFIGDVMRTMLAKKNGRRQIRNFCANVRIVAFLQFFEKFSSKFFKQKTVFLTFFAKLSEPAVHFLCWHFNEDQAKMQNFQFKFAKNIEIRKMIYVICNWAFSLPKLTVATVS